MKNLLIALIVTALAAPMMASAHGGRTDKDGCHRDVKAGTRHCH